MRWPWAATGFGGRRPQVYQPVAKVDSTPAGATENAVPRDFHHGLLSPANENEVMKRYLAGGFVGDYQPSRGAVEEFEG